MRMVVAMLFFFFQAEDGIRDTSVTGFQTCALPIYWFEPEEDIYWGPEAEWLLASGNDKSRYSGQRE